MTVFSYTNLDSKFTDLTADASGAEVLIRWNDIKTFLNSGDIDTSNIDTTAIFSWTARHAWTVADASNNNRSLTVSSVMAVNKYGDYITSAAAQINSPLMYRSISNAASSVSIVEYSNAGTGDTVKVSNSNTGSCFHALTTSTGQPYKATIRTLTDLNAPLVSKVITTPTTVVNDATETEVSDVTISLPANFLKAGTTIKGTLYGYMESAAAGGDIRVVLRYGGLAGTVLLDTGVYTPTANLVKSPLKLDFMLTCISTGAAGTIEAQGIIFWDDNTNPTPYGLGIAGDGTANNAVIAIDTTVASDLMLAVKWSAADADDEISIRTGVIEIKR